MDEGSPVDVIYLDFQKTFDKVPHQRLILKLKSHVMGKSFSPFSSLETTSTSLWASLYHHLPVLSVLYHVSSQFVFAHIFSVVVDPSPCRPPLLLFLGTTMSIIFLDKLSSSLLLICPYNFNRFCLRIVDIWHTNLASSCMLWFLIWSFLVLPLIHRSILISATCNLFSSFFLTAQLCDCWLDHRLIHLVFQFDGYLFVA